MLWSTPRQHFGIYSASILYHKGLYKQSLKILDKSKEVALQHEEKNLAYEIVELAHSRNLPFSKAFEFTTLKENDSNSLEELDLTVGLHQYIYNVGESTVFLHWKLVSRLSKFWPDYYRTASRPD